MALSAALEFASGLNASASRNLIGMLNPLELMLLALGLLLKLGAAPFHSDPAVDLSPWPIFAAALSVEAATSGFIAELAPSSGIAFLFRFC